MSVSICPRVWSVRPWVCARCTMAAGRRRGGLSARHDGGTATLIVESSPSGDRLMFTVPVFNIAPAPGEPLALAFNALFFPVRIDTSVLSDGEYNVRVTAPDITTARRSTCPRSRSGAIPAEHNGPGPDAAARTRWRNRWQAAYRLWWPRRRRSSTATARDRNRVRQACAVVDEPDAVLGTADGRAGNGFVGSAGELRGREHGLDLDGYGHGLRSAVVQAGCLDAAGYAGSGRPGGLFVRSERAAEHRTGRFGDAGCEAYVGDVAAGYRDLAVGGGWVGCLHERTVLRLRR